MRYAGLVRSGVATAMCATALLASSAQALVFDMTVNLGSLSGGPGILAFDFFGTAGTVELQALSPLGETSGDVVPPDVPPWTFMGIETLYVTYPDPLGLPADVRFVFKTSDGPQPEQPDVFSFSILDLAFQPRLTTTYPEGSDDCLGQLIIFNLGDLQPVVCTVTNEDVVGVGVVLNPPQSAVPEPATLALVLAGLAAASLRRKTAAGARQSGTDQS